MANNLTEIQMDAAALLWLSPCTFEELCERLNKPQYGFWTVIKIAMDKGWIYEKADVLHCYKKTVRKVLNPNGYELDIDHHKQKERRLETQFAKDLRKAGLI